jgi:hypothetical protein
LAVAVALLAFLVLPGRGGSHSKHSKPSGFSSMFSTINEGSPVAVSPSVLAAVSTHLKIPVYWAGPQPGHTLKLRTSKYGNVVLLYLTAGTPLRTTVQRWLTVITNPYQSDPYARLVREAARRGYGHHRLPGGKLVVSLPNAKEAYFASPHSHLLVEVYDPSAGVALREVLSGRVRSVG